jgi:hypothetical protein
VAPVLHFDNAVTLDFQAPEEPEIMRRVVASLLLLLLAVVLAPTPAQAVVFSMFQDLFPFGSTNEPGMLLLTGVTLLSLAHLGRSRR